MDVVSSLLGCHILAIAKSFKVDNFKSPWHFPFKINFVLNIKSLIRNFNDFFMTVLAVYIFQ